MLDKKTIDCVVQHLNIFNKQATYREMADIGEPCETCPYARECKFDWLSIMGPLLDQSDIRINLAYRDMPDIPDSNGADLG